MVDDARQFIASVGGYREVAKRLNKVATTVHTHMQAGQFPAVWYIALCDLAQERGEPAPAHSLFSFVSLPDPEKRGAA